MTYNPDDPLMQGYIPLNVFRDMDASRSSRRVREDSDVTPITEHEVIERLAAIATSVFILPTSAAGLAPGRLWRDAAAGNVVKIVPPAD